MKNWKKIEDYFWRNIENKHRPFASLKIRPFVIPCLFYSRKNTKKNTRGYVVSIGNYEGDIENYSKHFATKSRALAFAESYMKKRGKMNNEEKQNEIKKLKEEIEDLEKRIKETNKKLKERGI